MKEIFLFLMGLLCINADIWNEKPRAFGEGKTFKFQYSSQVLTGLRKTSFQYNGLQINSLVQLRFLSSSKIIMVLKDPEILETLEPIRTRNPQNLADKMTFEKSLAYPKELFKKLQKPVTFSWSIGKKIMDFKVHEKDETFSINIKRGILNMLNMKVIFDENDWKKEGGNYVITDDEGIDGICEANYIWSSYPYKTSASKEGDQISLSIVRTKSANRCKEPVGYDMANFVPIRSTNGNSDFNRTFVKNINEASINITLSKSNKFFVWEAKARSSYSIDREDHSKESLTSYIVQELTFLEEYKPKNIDFKENMVQRSLIMDMTKAEVRLSKNDKTAVLVLIDQLLNSTFNVIPKLISLLRYGNVNDIQEISEKVKSISKNKPNLLKPYLNVLSEVLTFPSTKSLFEDFILKPMPHINDDSEMAILIGPMTGISNVPDTKLIDFLTTAASKAQLLKHKNRSNTLKSTWLTIGSLAGSYYIRNPSYDIKSTIKFFTKLIMDIDSSLSKETKAIIVLKALGNMGVLESLSYLKEILTNRSQNMSNRVQAVYSLRKIQRTDTEIERMLLTIFSDVNGDVELRLAAGVDIVLKHRSKSTLNMFVALLKREPILQVKAYMQDVIFHLSGLPNFKDVLRPILEKIDVKDYSEEYSKMVTVPIKDGILVVSAIYSPESRIPRSGNILFYDFKFGKSLILFEIGFRIDNKENSKIKTSLDKGVFQYIQDTIKIPESIGNKDFPKMTVYYKKYDNEIGYWSVEDELLKSFSVETFLDLAKFIKGEKNIEMNYNLNFIANGDLQLPTTMGLLYSAKVHNFFDLRLSVDCSNVIKPHPQTEIRIKPYWMNEVLLDVGVDAKFIKSELSARVFSVTPQLLSITLFIDAKLRSYSLGMKKLNSDIRVVKFTLSKKFKTTYLNQTNTQSELFKSTNITPFYVAEKNVGKMKNSSFTFPFGMSVTWNYFCDVGKPRSDGHSMSWLSAGDAYFDVWIKSWTKMNFDEFKWEIKEKSLNETIKYVVFVNYIKNKKVVSRVDLITLKHMFGVEKKVEIIWPENYYIDEEIEMKSANSYKIPNIKYLRFEGVYKLPLPIRFNKKDPFKILRNKDEYSYILNGNLFYYSGGSTLMKTEMKLGMDEEAHQLGKAISNNTYKYMAHSENIYRCLKDMELKMSNSPACFHSFINLNSFNKLTIFLNYTDMGYMLFRNRFYDFNQRLTISKNLKYQKIIDRDNHYQFEYTVPPFYHSSSITTISVASLSNGYKDVLYPRTDVVAKTIRTFGDLTPTMSDYKICQLRRGERNVISVKTFDNYMYNVKDFLPRISENETVKLTFVQDDKNSFQISAIIMKSQLIIQIMGKELPVLRISKIRDNVEFKVDNIRSNTFNVVVDTVTLATMRILPNSIYGDKTTYEIVVPIHNIRILTDMVEMLDIEASINYRSSLRGVCGDMDGELFNEFKSANCSGNYASPENMFKKSEYKSSFQGHWKDMDVAQFISIKMCQRYTKLALL